MLLMQAAHEAAAPSDWVVRFAPLIRPKGCVLDVASGSGRHLRWLAAQGHLVTGVDISAENVLATQGFGAVVQADIENGPWPFLQGSQPRQFDAVIVTNYLWRPLFPVLLSSLAPGAVLIYETFGQGNEQYGRPSRADFLLHPGELLWRCAALSVVAYEQGLLKAPERVVQRIVAVRAAGGSTSLGKMAHYPI